MLGSQQRRNDMSTTETICKYNALHLRDKVAAKKMAESAAPSAATTIMKLHQKLVPAFKEAARAAH